MRLDFGTLHIAVSEFDDGNMSDAFGEGNTATQTRALFLAKFGLEARDLCLLSPDASRDVTLLRHRTRVVWGNASVTDEMGIALGVCPTDFPSVVLFSPGDDVLGHVHCSRVALESSIIAEAVKSFRKLGLVIEEVRAFVIPGSGSCCYHFERAYYEEYLQKHWPNAPKTKEGRYAIDLLSRIRRDLTQQGITQVMTIGGCSVCSRQVYSERRETAGQLDFLGRNLVIAWLK